MKQLLFSIVVFTIGMALGDIIKSNNAHQQYIGQSKSVKVSKTRYFFVGYQVENESKHAYGNVQWFCNDGLPPVKMEVYKFLKKDMPSLDFTYDQLAIVGLHEFKDKTECDMFFNRQKNKK